METKIFTTKQFHLWPFYNWFTWRGFLPTYSITVENESISFTINNNLIEKYTAEGVEASLFNSTWFGLGKTKIGFSKKYNDVKKKRGDHWYFFHNDYCYLDPIQVPEAINAFKEIDTKCFNDQSISLRDGKLWMTSDNIIEYNGNDKIAFWALSIPHIKYYYTQKSWWNPFAKPVLVTGSDHPMRIKKLSSNDVEKLQKYLIENGAKLGEFSKEVFNNAFYFSVLYNPKLWFTSFSLGLGDDGIIFSEKTFNTKENLYLPYDKISCAVSNKKWWWTTRQLYIFGEQNIIPKKRLSLSDATRIVNELREKGIKKLEGSSYSASYHSSWMGVLLSWVTLGIYHMIVMLFSKKRNTITIGNNNFSWLGNIWKCFHGKVDIEELNFYFGLASDVISVCYIKEHWYHWWGTLGIRIEPKNIRSLAYEASQNCNDYVLVLNKVYSSTASSIKNELQKAGYKDSSKMSKKDWKRIFKHIS